MSQASETPAQIAARLAKATGAGINAAVHLENPARAASQRSDEVRHDHKWDNAKQATVDYQKHGETLPQVGQRVGQSTKAAGQAVVEGENPVRAAQGTSQAAKQAHERDNRGQY